MAAGHCSTNSLSVCPVQFRGITSVDGPRGHEWPVVVIRHLLANGVVVKRIRVQHQSLSAHSNRLANGRRRRPSNDDNTTCHFNENCSYNLDNKLEHFVQ